MKQLNHTNAKQLGQYLGPVLTLLFLSEIVTLDIYKTPASPHIVYLNGFVLFLFGFYIARVHTVWTKRWPILITIAGWGMTALGLLRLFFPDASQAPANTATRVMLGVFMVLGLLLTIKAYRSTDSDL